MPWTKLIAAAALSVTAALGLSAPASAGSQALSNEDILHNLMTVVFGSEFLGQDTSYVRKWTGPMLVAVEGDEGGQHETLIQSHLDTLRRLTGLEIVEVPATAPDANARIVFIDRSRFGEAATSRLGAGKPGTNANLACFARFTTDARGRIFSFEAVIPQPISAEEAEACIIEEMTQVLGLPNDSFDIHPTIFNDDDVYHRLTWQDELMLRVLYDSSIAPRMNRAAFAVAARDVIDQLHPEEGSMMIAEAAATPAPAAVAALQGPIETLPLARGRDHQ
jgi:hypothetical protein